MIPTYNCAGYLRETLRSVLDQDPGPEHMEIEVVDDCSTRDDPEAVVRELGRGRVRFYRQPRNRGAIGNFNTCIRRSRGIWLHILHGDDTVRRGFYAEAQRAIEAHPQVGAVTCRFVHMDEDSVWTYLSEIEARHSRVLGSDFLARMMLINRIMFPAIALRRSVYETLGGFRPELVHCADWDMWLRAAREVPVFYNPEALACYRVHSGADTARLMATGENVVDERRFMNILVSYVPPENRDAAYRNGMQASAIRAIRRSKELWRRGKRAVAIAQFREALQCSLAPSVLKHVVQVLLWVAFRDPLRPIIAEPQAPAPDAGLRSSTS
jgi:glycosyltransferase involved in cell wall biosynthesis